MTTWPSTVELQGLQDTVESWFYDRCVIVKNTLTEADDGELIVSNGTSTSTACRWTSVSASENVRGPLILSSSAWRLVVPKSASLGHQDRVRLTHKMGMELVVPIETQVDGNPQHVVGALQANLKAIET